MTGRETVALAGVVWGFQVINNATSFFEDKPTAITTTIIPGEEQSRQSIPHEWSSF